MSENLGQLGGELELLIDAGHVVAPALRALRLQWPIKGGIDLAAIEILGDVGELVPMTFLHIGRIDNALPVWILEARGAEEDQICGPHCFRLDETGAKG